MSPLKNTATVLALALTLSALPACKAKNPALSGPVRPTPPAAVPKLGPTSTESFFGFSTSQSTAEQARYDENTVSVLFQAGKDGQSVNNLTAQDLDVTENSIPVTPFTLSKMEDHSNQVADIILLVDITGTMVDLIAEAKARLKEFVNSEKARKYHLRWCISTFGDYTVKKCARFYDINPKDSSFQSQRRDLLNELARLQAYRGDGRDPGYPDLDENPMGALVDASKAPWGPDSQRFVILVTDWGFLYSPDNQGEQFKRGMVQQPPPTMKQVNDALRESQIKVFAVTRTRHVHRGQELVWDGYNTPFQGEPGIVQASGGEYYDFDQVRTGQVSLTQLFNRIVERINTTYTLTYVVDKVPGLDPSLPVDRRNVEIRVKSVAGATVKKTSTLASKPTGRPQYQQTWKISDSNLDPDSMHVFLDGKELNKSEFSVHGSEVRFKSVPPPGAKMRFVYLYESSELNLKLEPIRMPGSLNAGNTRVLLNGIEARAEDILFSPDVSGSTDIGFKNSIMASNDPYLIRKNQGVKVQIVTNR